MIEGVVTRAGVPEIELTVGGREWLATIDTGFNGGMELPDKLREELDLVFIGRDRTVLASGITIDEDYYQLSFLFDGKMHDIEVTFADVDRLLIGTALMKSHHLDIDFPNKTVRLERRAAS